MTCLNSSAGYTGYRGYTYAGHLYGVREGGSPPSQYPIPTLVKTSDIYVTYVTPVTCLKFLGFVLGRGFGSAAKPDCLPYEYEIKYLRAGVCRPSESRRNRVEDLLDNIRSARRVATITPRSLSETLSVHVNNCVEQFRNFFWFHLEILKEMIK